MKESGLCNLCFFLNQNFVIYFVDLDCYLWADLLRNLGCMYWVYAVPCDKKLIQVACSVFFNFYFFVKF